AGLQVAYPPGIGVDHRACSLVERRVHQLAEDRAIENHRMAPAGAETRDHDRLAGALVLRDQPRESGRADRRMVHQMNHHGAGFGANLAKPGLERRQLAAHIVAILDYDDSRIITWNRAAYPLGMRAQDYNEARNRFEHRGAQAIDKSAAVDFQHRLGISHPARLAGR